MQIHDFLSEKMLQKETKKRVIPGWTDISGPAPVGFLSKSFMYHIEVTLHNPINLLNVVRTNSFF